VDPSADFWSLRFDGLSASHSHSRILPAASFLESDSAFTVVGKKGPLLLHHSRHPIVSGSHQKSLKIMAHLARMVNGLIGYLRAKSGVVAVSMNPYHVSYCPVSRLNSFWLTHQPTGVSFNDFPLLLSADIIC